MKRKTERVLRRLGMAAVTLPLAGLAATALRLLGGGRRRRRARGGPRAEEGVTGVTGVVPADRGWSAWKRFSYYADVEYQREQSLARAALRPPARRSGRSRDLLSDTRP